MHIHPRLRGLRGDDAPQLRDQDLLGDALEVWRSEAGVAALDAELVRLARGEALAQLPVLSGLFGVTERSAAAPLDALVRRLVLALRSAPLGQVPLRHFCDDTIAMLVLARHGPVSLWLQSIDGAGVARRPQPASVSLSCGETWEVILAGSAEVQRIRLVSELDGKAILDRTPQFLRVGDRIHRQGAHETAQFVSVSGSLVSLKLQHRAPSGEPTREFCLKTGALLHQAAGSACDSRFELAANLLGRMARADAAPVLAGMAVGTASAALRWQTLRECLTLDTALGFSALCQVACNTADPLAVPAGALRSQLLEAHPQLAALDEKVPACPA